MAWMGIYFSPITDVIAYPFLNTGYYMLDDVLPPRWHLVWSVVYKYENDGEGIVHDGLPFPDSGCPVPDAGNIYLINEMIDEMINVYA